MNERIQELYAQAIQYADSVVPANNRYNDIYYAIASGKHAELIVRECIEQLEIGKRCDPYTGELFVCDRNNDIDYDIAVLKEHFGVEE